MLSTRMQGAAFAPNHVPNLQLWLDAADVATITESSGAVSQWDDKSGQGNHASQGMGSAQPQLVSDALNGRSGIRFDGTNVLDLSIGPNIGGYSFLMVMRLNDAISTGQTFPRMFRASNDSQAIFLRKSTNNFEIKSQANGANDPRPIFDYESVCSTGTPALISTHVQLDSLQTWANDTQQFDTNRSATALTLISDATSEIGSIYTGDFFEMLLFERVVTDAERRMLECYLAAKWSVGL